MKRNISAKAAAQRKMKPSGVDWIGDVPEGWGIVPIKYLTSCNDEVLPENTDSYYEFDYVEIGDVKYENGIGSVERIIFGDAPSRARRIVRTEDVIISTVRTYLKAVASIEEFEFPLIVSTGFAVLRATDVYYRYLYYAMLSQDFQSQVTLYSKGVSYPAITSNSLLHIPIRVPSLDEQKRIAAKLDRLCGRVDELAENLKGEIAALQEYRKSLITECVTKGLNPKAKMKPSGVDWIGDVPEGWTVMRTKYVSKVQTGPFGTQLSADSYTEDGAGVPCVNVKNIGDGVFRVDDLDRVKEDVAERLVNYGIKSGDVIFARKGSVDKRTVAEDEQDGWILGSDSIGVRFDEDVMPRYACYYYGNGVMGQHLHKMAKGSTMPSMNAEIIGNLEIIIPPFDEQKEIAAFLDKRCAVVDAKIAERQRQLEKLGEYRSSVIYEYVTGKKGSTANCRKSVLMRRGDPA